MVSGAASIHASCHALREHFIHQKITRVRFLPETHQEAPALHIRLIRIKALNEALTLEEEESSDAEEEYVGTTDQPYQP